MKQLSDIAILIQARTSSQRCPKKMVRPFAGSTLMDICLNKLVNSPDIPNQNIWASIYEQELVDICSKYPINIFHRSERSAKSEGYPLTEIFEWWNKIPQKYVIIINACVPLLSIDTITGFINAYIESESDGMFGVIEKKNYFWDNQNRLLTPLKKSMNTKMTPVVKEAAHCLYAGKLEHIEKNVWMGEFDQPGSVVLYSLPENECFDIDYEWQFTLAEKIYKTLDR